MPQEILILAFWILAQAAPSKEIEGLLEPIRKKHGVPALGGAIVTVDGMKSVGVVGVRKAGTDVPATIEDRWHLGSDTKAMTAALIGALVEKGKLSWDDKVVGEITYIDLLSHRSGLPANLEWRKIAQQGTVREQRAEALQSAEGKLGERKYLYSNFGYVVAAAMVERKLDQSWEELIEEHLFKPLKMSRVGFGGTGTEGKIDQPWGHRKGGKPVEKNGPECDNPPVVGPAGTVNATIEDWSRFIADQLGEKGLLKPETYKKLHTPVGDNYALGWMVTEREWGGGTVLNHAGCNTMNYAVVWMAPRKGFAVLVVCNQGDDVAAQACDEAASALIRLHAKTVR